METIKADPEAAGAVRAAIESQWFRLEEVGGGITAAREANAVYLQPNAPGFWLNPAFWVSAGFLLMPFMILMDMLFVRMRSANPALESEAVT